MLTGFDLHLLGEGTHVQAFDKLGARVIEHDGVSGVHFAVWAPNARSINVVGDFNSWTGTKHPMRALEQSGYWEIFVPGLAQRAKQDRWRRQPMSTYEVHLGSWQRSPGGKLHSYREMAESLVPYVKDM